MPRDAFEVMDLKSLRCFFAVVQHGSLTRAGIELGISEAAISQRVHGLEGYLGAKLYETRGGRVKLTAAGEQTARLAVSVFSDIEVLEHAVANERESGVLTVASHDSVLRYLLPGRFETFCREYPLARLRLLARPIEETVRLVRANECDLGVVPQRKVPEDLLFKAVASYPACLILAKGHALARRGSGDFAALIGDGVTGRYPLVMLEVQREDQRLQRAFEALKVPFDVALEVSTVDTLKHYVLRGLGVGVVSGFCVLPEDRARMEVIAIPEEYGGTTTYGLVLRRDKHRSPLLKALMAQLSSFDAAESGGSR
jgi:DNA-binding transcriptional LysR family regulator